MIRPPPDRDLATASDAALVAFTLDERRFALRLSAVEQVCAMVDIVSLPDAPAIVLGAIDVHGTVTPVVDVRRRFGLPQRAPDVHDHLLIARTARRRLALVADRVEGVVHCRPGDIVTCTDLLPPLRHVQGIAKLQDGLTLVHDLERFLSLDEEQSLDRALA